MSRETIRNAIFILFVGPLALRAEWLYRKMPTLRRSYCDGPLPSLSIIVPARNEAENLQRLLPSLCQLDYPGPLELIVVNDNSKDDTAVIAESYGAKVVHIDGLPEGWLGKPHACHHGASVAQGDFLLFTDADTFHKPESAKSAIAHLLQNNLDGLSIYLKQETKGFVDTLVLMVAFAGLYAGLTEKE